MFLRKLPWKKGMHRDRMIEKLIEFDYPNRDPEREQEPRGRPGRPRSQQPTPSSAVKWVRANNP